MAGEHAEVALGAGHVDLIDLAGEQQLFRRDEIEVEGGHVAQVRIISLRRFAAAYAASAASFLPFSTASSMVPTM